MGAWGPREAVPRLPPRPTWRSLGAGDVGGGRDHAGCGGQVAGGGQRRLAVQSPEFLEDRACLSQERPGSQCPQEPRPEQGMCCPRLEGLLWATSPGPTRLPHWSGPSRGGLGSWLVKEPPNQPSLREEKSPTMVFL